MVPFSRSHVCLAQFVNHSPGQKWYSRSHWKQWDWCSRGIILYLHRWLVSLITFLSCPYNVSFELWEIFYWHFHLFYENISVSKRNVYCSKARVRMEGKKKNKVQLWERKRGKQRIFRCGHPCFLWHSHYSHPFVLTKKCLSSSLVILIIVDYWLLPRTELKNGGLERFLSRWSAC